MMSSRQKLTGATLGKRIEEAFRLAGMNRTQFAKALGAGYMTTYDWGRDKYRPRADYLQRIAEITGYSASEILGEADSPREASDIPPTLAAFLASELADDVTDDEVEQLRVFPWQGRPTLKSYHFALLAIRAQLSSEDARRRPSR